MVILPEIPQGRRTSPWRRQTDVVERFLTNATLPDYREEATPERSKQHGKHTSIKMAYDAQPSMMHVQFKYAWHGKVHKQHYKLSGAQYATGCILAEHHIKLFSSISFMYPTILNVVKHGKRVKQKKTTYLCKFKWGRNNKPQVRKLLICIY